MRDWYVAKVKPRGEQLVAWSLAASGAEVYAPDIVVLKRGRQVLEPLFPGYVFVQVDTAAALWRQIRWAQGVSYFLPGNLAPVPIGAAFVDDLKSKVERWNGEGWATAFGMGDPVRIEAGPLVGLDAIFHRYVPGHRRCEVLVSLVGRDHRVSVDTRSLRALTLGRGTFTYAPAG